MVYHDTSPSDIAWGAISLIANITLWAGRVFAEHLGDPAGSVVAATAAAYSAILGIIFSLLMLGLFTNQLVYRVYFILKRLFPCGGRPGRYRRGNIRFRRPVLPHYLGKWANAIPILGPLRAANLHVWHGDRPVKHIACGVLERKITHYILLLFRADTLNHQHYMTIGLPRRGRVKDPNFPFAADLCSQLRLGYSARKQPHNAHEWGDGVRVILLQMGGQLSPNVPSVRNSALD